MKPRSDADLWQALDVLTQRIDGLVLENEALTERLDNAMTASASRVEQLTTLQNDVESVTARVTDHISEASDNAASVIERFAAVDKSLATVPKQFVIDKAGDLIAFTNADELRRLGRVVAEPSPTIKTVDMLSDRIRLHMTDGSTVSCELSRPVAETLPDVSELDDAVRASIIMEGAVNSYAEIGKRYGITARQVAQVVRDANGQG